MSTDMTDDAFDAYFAKSIAECEAYLAELAADDDAELEAELAADDDAELEADSAKLEADVNAELEADVNAEVTTDFAKIVAEFDAELAKELETGNKEFNEASAKLGLIGNALSMRDPLYDADLYDPVLEAELDQLMSD